MFDIILSFLAGVIQGLTEFLPVSSSGHLVILHDLFGFKFIDNLAFDVVLHLGTMVAILAFFCCDLFKYFVAGLKSLLKPRSLDQDQRLAWFIALATIPAGLFGFFLENQIESVFRNPAIVAVMMILVGIILYLADNFATQTKDLSRLSLSDSLVIGFSQVLALIPGVSRSGITIIAGLSRKLNRRDAAYFSFLISAPVILGAGLKKSIDLMQVNISRGELLVLIIGFLTSAVTGYLCIKFFLKYLENNSLRIFAYYRIVLGSLVIIYMLFF